MKLTVEQQQLAADNHNLIYSFLKKYHLPVEDWYDIAAIGLCKAAATYNRARGSFATHAYQCMYNDALKNDHYQHRKKRDIDNEAFSINVYSKDSGDELIGMFSAETDFTAPIVDEIVGLLDCRELMVIKMSLLGASLEEIENAIGYGRGTIYKARRSAKKKIRAYLKGAKQYA